MNTRTDSLDRSRTRTNTRTTPTRTAASRGPKAPASADETRDTTPSTPSRTEPADDAALQARQRAWELTREQRRAIDPAQLAPANFDLRVGLTTITAALERALPYRAQLLAELPGLDPRCIDMLATYCAAIEYGALRVRWQRESALDANALAEKHLAKCLRAMAPLEDVGLLPAGTVDEIRQGAGWHDRVDDLTRVVVTLDELWPTLAGRTTLTRDDIALADALAKRLSAHLGAKGQPTEPDDVRLERRQALTLALNAYEDLRAALTWLRRRERDANKIAPSVYMNPYNPRGRASSRDDDGDDGEGNDDGEGEGTKPAPIDAKPTDAKGAVVTKQPTDAKTLVVAKKPTRANEDDDDGPIERGPNGLPLVPQDDPFARD